MASCNIQAGLNIKSYYINGIQFSHANIDVNGLSVRLY